MKTTILAFLASTLVLYADPSDDAKESSPDGSFLAAARRIPDAEFIWRHDLDSTLLVVLPIGKGGETGSIMARHKIRGRLISQLRWSPDSKFLVLTTTSSGGHSPEHFKTFVFCMADKSFRSVDSGIGVVVAPDFHFEGTDTVVMKVRDSELEAGKLDEGKVTKLALHMAVQNLAKAE